MRLLPGRPAAQAWAQVARVPGLRETPGAGGAGGTGLGSPWAQEHEAAQGPEASALPAQPRTPARNAARPCPVPAASANLLPAESTPRASSQEAHLSRRTEAQGREATASGHTASEAEPASHPGAPGPPTSRTCRHLNTHRPGLSAGPGPCAPHRRTGPVQPTGDSVWGDTQRPSPGLAPLAALTAPTLLPPSATPLATQPHSGSHEQAPGTRLARRAGNGGWGSQVLLAASPGPQTHVCFQRVTRALLPGGHAGLDH